MDCHREPVSGVIVRTDTNLGEKLAEQFLRDDNLLWPD